MGDREFIGADPVARHQQPATAPLFHRMQAIACDALRNLDMKCGIVEEQQPAERGIAGRRCLQSIGPHPQAIAWNLHHDSRRRSSHPPDDRQADHPFVADGGQLDPGAIFHHGELGKHSVTGKIGVIERSTGLIKNNFESEGDMLQVRKQLFVLVNRQTCQKQIRGHFARRIALSHGGRILSGPTWAARFIKNCDKLYANDTVIRLDEILIN